MNYSVRWFQELDNETLYNILKLRGDVFVVEQECAYPDIDGKDLDALHIVIESGKEICACCRILPKGVNFPSVTIGRVVVHPNRRREGLGRELVQYAMRYILEEMQADSIMLAGQVYLREFYKSLGFKVVSEDYLEDGIPHCNMLYEK